MLYKREVSCPKCESSSISKNGMVKGVKHYKCKDCQYQSTRTTPRVRAAADKAQAVKLFLVGVTMNAIARLLKVPTPSVLRWIRKFAQDSESRQM